MQVKFSFDVPQYYIVKFSKVIREKLDVIMLQLDVLYCIQSGIREMPNGNLVIENGDIKRMYFFEQNRYYSASFPFLIKKGDSEEEGYSFYCNDIEISSSLLGMRTNSWTRLEDASCILQKHKLPKPWKHSMI